ncbi:hypothetical protein GUITHDRAFT_108260 [Guillardia theta CCMP2712]|uniref:Uncharacterized protein n=1 Tax=Guillardia theta (strain CCMP2712) TaxID=905079 RepID=L1JCK5_GUITC|nr:hypothetical protein GUITHDRAFT_108260 [Guillardia theta CCMP2712]EKX45810.1 hypothetical protein GUITHDRAFT_108260 [Guillardia theta CCMP2712]|eukprot:XP_005832790.1 hypothetical protein GUITHDRAFT_108260 [Guillardia theta CCMP2712]
MGNINCTFQDRTCFPWTDENQMKLRRRQEEKERGKEVDVNTWRYSWMSKNALANKLYSYCEHDHADGINNLCVEHGAVKYINFLNQEGVAPLHVACLHGSKNAVLVLLAHGADASLKTAGGASPLQIAREANQPEVADILSRVSLSAEDEEVTLSQRVSSFSSLRLPSARSRLDSLDSSSIRSGFLVRSPGAGGDGSWPTSARQGNREGESMG